MSDLFLALLFGSKPHPVSHCHLFHASEVLLDDVLLLILSLPMSEGPSYVIAHYSVWAAAY